VFECGGGGVNRKKGKQKWEMQDKEKTKQEKYIINNFNLLNH
jgi:hypothetical protein